MPLIGCYFSRLPHYCSTEASPRIGAEQGLFLNGKPDARDGYDINPTSAQHSFELESPNPLELFSLTVSFETGFAPKHSA
jgi:hypothetical protein